MNTINTNANKLACHYLLTLNTSEQALATLSVTVISPQENGRYLTSTSPQEFDALFAKISPEDQKLLYWLKVAYQQKLQHDIDGHAIPLQNQLASQILPLLLASERCHWLSLQHPPLKLGQNRNARLEWEKAGQGLRKLACHVAGSTCAILPIDPLWYVDQQCWECGIISTELSSAVILKLLAAPPMNETQIKALYAALGRSSFASPTAPKRSHSEKITDIAIVPELKLCLLDVMLENPFDPNSKIAGKIPVAELRFTYLGHSIPALKEGNKLSFHSGPRIIETERDVQAERKAFLVLKKLGLYPLAKETYISNYKDSDKNECAFFILEEKDSAQAWLTFNLEKLPELRERKWQIHTSEDYPYHVIDETQVEWYTQLYDTPGHRWFNIELGITIQGEKINLLPLLVAAIEKYMASQNAPITKLPEDGQLITTLPDGRLLPVPVARLKPILDILTELFDRHVLSKQGRLKLSRIRAAQLLALEQSVADKLRFRWWGGQSITGLANKLQHFEKIKTVPLPEGLNADLRPYQQEGLDWLQFLREFEVGGILADDMGLGKTIQTIAHIMIEKQTGRLTHPCLVVAPTSLMSNWRTEIERFAPSLSILTLHGNARQENFQHIQNYDLVLTTYPLIVRDHATLTKQEFHIIVLDEAQIIKNSRSKAALYLNKMDAKHRLCLTGTPLENHLGELWSLFNFLMPGFLGDQAQFTRLFRTPIEKYQDQERRNQLTERLRPFLLRRTKQSVALDLPDKNEIICSIDLEDVQRDLYESIRLSLNETVYEAIEKKGFANSHLIILDALLKLRQICCDPRLLKLSSAHKSQAKSAKLLYLKEMLPNLIEEGRRVLLFSQFTEMLALIETEVQALGIPYVKLTGQTLDRKDPIDRFQNCEVPLFLISLKAGGLGLNLTAADTVIHYDPWWNPAVERQATDRAHRIGQSKHVFVYKLITKDTVEEKILALQEKKEALLKHIYQGESEKTSIITQEDLKVLLDNVNFGAASNPIAE